MDLNNVVAEILDQQAKIFDLLGFDERPEPRAPADSASLAKLESWWMARTGSQLPPSFRQFLVNWNGIRNFSVSYSLFGADDLMSSWYEELLEGVLSAGVGFEINPEFPPVLVGYDPETTTRVLFEFAHERSWADEPVVLEGDPGDLTLHQSFGRFLEARVEANRYTIAELSQRPPSLDE